MILAHIFHIDSLSAFGLVAVGLMLAFYAMESRSPFFTLLFACACAMGSGYGFAQGAWPFGLVEGIWSLVALRKWWQLRSDAAQGASPSQAGHTRDNVDAFLEDLIRLTSQPGPTTYAFSDPDGSRRGFVQLYRPCRGRLLVHRVWADKPRQGAGSHIMQTLCDLADLHGVEIVLQPLPFGPKPFPMSVDQLCEWYQGWGFIGSAKRMMREPNPSQFDQAYAENNVAVAQIALK